MTTSSDYLLTDSHTKCRSIMGRLQKGDSRAEVVLYQRYVGRLIGLAKSRLHSRLKAKIDPDDVVQSAFRSFFRRHARGNFLIDGWDSLWALLARITVRKCNRQVGLFSAEKRDVNREQLSARPQDSRCNFDALSREPGPDDLAAFTDTLEQLLQGLSPKQVEVVLLRLEDFTNEEISDRVGRTERTVYRILSGVRAQLIHLESALENRD